MTKADFASYAKGLSLESLVQNIHYCHQQAESRFLDGLEWAFGTGLFLIWIKEKVVEHTEFEKWVRDNCPFKKRQAQRYMRLVRKWPEIQAKATSEDAFPESVAGLLEFVAEEQTNPDEDAQQVSDADRSQDANTGADQDDSDEAEADQDDDDLVDEDEADQDEPEKTQDKNARRRLLAKSGGGAKAKTAERQIVNYKCGGTTKVTVAPHPPKSFLVTLKSVEPHDLFIELDGQSAEKLRQQLEAALAKTTGDVGHKKRPAKTASPAKPRQPKPKVAMKTVTIRQLTSFYGNHALPVLHEYLKERPRKKGGMRTYKIAKPLPTEAEFNELQKKKYTSTVADLVGSAFGDLENLASEVGDWYDNLPEGLQSSDKGSVLDDARGTLESLSEPDLPEAVATKEVYYLPLLDAGSRAARRDDAIGRLQAVVDAPDPDNPDSEIRELARELENAISEAEGVEFPGMY